MAEEFDRNKAYSYHANSNLVLEADRGPRRGKKEDSGEVSTLHGKLDSVRMGDRIDRSETTSSLNEKKSKAKKKQRHDNADLAPSKKSRNGDSGQNILTATDDFNSLNYQPQTRETRGAYEEILSSVQQSLGDQPQDILRGAADEIISLLKDDTLRDPVKQKEVGKILGAVNNDKFNKFVNLGKRLVDFRNTEEKGDENEGKMDEEAGVAVDFDDSDDSEEDDQVLDDDDEDEDEDGVEETKVSGTLRHGDDEDNTMDTDNASSEDGSKISVHDIDAHWLQRKLSTYYSDANVSIKLSEDVLNALQLADERARENSLVALLDYDKFDFVKLLLLNHSRIQFCTRLKQAQSATEKTEVEAEMMNDIDGEGPNILKLLHSKASAENWTSDRIGQFADKARKEAKALNNNSAKDGNSSDFEAEEIVGGSEFTSTSTKPDKTLDLESLEFQQGSHLMTNKTCELPDKSWRAQKKGYEEVHVPAMRPIIPVEEKLVTIKELPEWAHPAFPGIKSLNRIQSKMVDAAFYNSENLLLCAPTGAGKTNVALMCILNQLGQHRRADGSFNLDAFKIVYVAPMKALVQENVLSFGKKLAPFGVNVRELSGDQNLTAAQISDTHIIVTTPEKWDIITRKAGDRTYTQLVRLMIIDEIHLLHDERGPVLESLVARTLRQIETTQEMVRLVGLSATLPNFEDVATFLRVKPDKGLFFFDSSYRPVPLQQQYIGITEKKALKRFQLMNEICYEKVLAQAGKNQVLIFVQSRAETVKTAKALRDLAIENDTLNQFVPEESASQEILREESETAKNNDLKDLVQHGFAVHHAGLVRSDRTLVEDLFSDKHVQVLVSTATLAWGVNLPCHTVILKGTQIYNPEQGRWTELSPLDVMQMLGRAGRYGLDTEGEGIIMTQHSELQFYLSLMNQQLPIESQFVKRLPDMLNAEIVLGTVSSLKDAAAWLGYTYLYVRMLRNPASYGVSIDDLEKDPTLMQNRLNLVHTAATVLDKSNIIKYDRKSGILQVTALGRVASHYYVSHDSIRVFTEYLKPTMSDVEIFRLFSMSGEFKNINVREEEKLELTKLLSRVPIPIKESVDEPAAKVNALLQAYISRLRLDGFALVADMTYIHQSASRLMRAIFEIALKRGWAALACKILSICQMIERKTWLSQSPLRQFGLIPEVLIRKLEKSGDIPWDRYYDLKPQDLGEMVKIPKMGKTLHKYVHMFPRCELNAHVLPITRSLLMVNLTITPDFQFDASVHDSALMFHIFVTDGDGVNILHTEPLVINEQRATQEHVVSFSVPIQDPLPPQYFVKFVSDRWLHSETVLPISFRNLILPQKYPPSTELLDLQPLPVSVLPDSLKSIFGAYKYFNPIQTQSFSALYETDDTTLICAPTGSGKTVCAELAMARLFTTEREGKCVYLCPKEEIADSAFVQMQNGVGSALGVKVVKLIGETASDLKLVDNGQIIVTSAKNWDIISRKWKQRKNIQNISMYIADELHLLSGADGSIIEVVLSRARYIASQLERKVRIVGLSSSLANAKDIGDWIGATQTNVFNFSPDVRPIPLEIKLHGFDTNHYASRILSMSKHTYGAISRNPPGKPSIVFVPSRKQAQLSAIDFITFAAAGGTPHRFLNVDPADIESVLDTIKEPALRQSVGQGVGYLHSGLISSDRKRVERLYIEGIINVLICPHDFCWKIPAPCYCVVVMDTVYFDGKEHQYVKYPITDILQMVGTASRPLSDDAAKCIILCHTPKKEYLKKLLHEPLPVESHFDHDLHDHMCAEIVTKTIENKQDAVDYLTWSLYYRRLTKNPNYYNLQGTTNTHLSDHLSELVEQTISDLEESKCVVVDDDIDLAPLNLSMIASHYYIHYTTVELFSSSITAKTKIKGALEIISAASEFGDLPLRQSEEKILKNIMRRLPKVSAPISSIEDASSKTLVLLQSHFCRQTLPAELGEDLKVVLRDSIKLLQALVDVTSSQGWLKPALAAMELSQMVVQGLWDRDSVLLQVPHFTSEIVSQMKSANPPVETVFDVLEMEDETRDEILKISPEQMSDVAQFCNSYPNIELNFDTDIDGDVAAGDVVTVVVEVQREVDEDEEDAGSLGKVASTRYPHEKTESWWLVVGDRNSNTLYATKRIAFEQRTKTKLQFNAPEEVGAHNLNLYFMSDSYLGCDQEYEIELNVSEAKMDEEEDEEEKE